MNEPNEATPCVEAFAKVMSGGEWRRWVKSWVMAMVEVDVWGGSCCLEAEIPWLVPDGLRYDYRTRQGGNTSPR